MHADTTVTVPEHTVVDDAPRQLIRVSPAGSRRIVAVTVKGYGLDNRRNAAAVAAQFHPDPTPAHMLAEGTRIIATADAGTLDTVPPATE